MLERWRERDVFHESIRRREGAKPFIFYEGPPTANGRPGSHHVLARVFKDVFPRYQTMRGHFVPRKAGWDCHGLPVELEVEKELGFHNKHDIERYGVAEFNAKCRESVLRYIDEWNELTERIGFWIDTDDAYYTLANDYVESVWWSLKQVWEKGLLTEGYRVVPYCTRCGTALSSHELAQGYNDVVDPSVYVKFPLKDEPDVSLLAWTTMPWTLVPHAAIAVDPEVTYARVSYDGQTLILAEPLVERVLGEGAEILDRMKGSELLGLRYEPPFPYISDYGERGHTVLPGDFVSIDDGTGVVHTGAAFGEDDFRLATENGLTIHNPVRPDGTFDERTGPFSGMYVREADAHIVEALRQSGRLLRAGEYEHSYPHCWRCDTPLIYYAKTSWYARTTEVKAELLAANESITWYPDHIKHGRFGKWLENNVDWALSRERYWGTPLPVWRCESDGGHVVCIGSMAEIAERGGTPPEDVHRPYIDEVVLTCEDCGGEMRRVPDLIDVWWDSGCMPFAQWHAPFENEGLAAERYPGRLHLRGARPDPRLVLFAARRIGAAVRRGVVPHVSLPRADPRPRGPEDVEVEGQCRRAMGRPDRARRRRVPLVLLHLQAALGWLPLLAGDRRRVGAPVPEAALEHVRLLRAVREPGGRSLRRGTGDRSRPVDPLAALGDDRTGHRANGGLRHDLRRPRDRRVHRRSVELVRAPLAPPLLARGRPGGLPHPARVPARRVEAARSAHAVRDRRDLRQPRRIRAVRPPLRLPGARRLGTRTSSGVCRSSVTRWSSEGRRGGTRR